MPLSQRCPLVQAVPHAPQLFESEASVTQRPPQLVSPAPQVKVSTGGGWSNACTSMDETSTGTRGTSVVTF
jgi:hypothetical protein